MKKNGIYRTVQWDDMKFRLTRIDLQPDYTIGRLEVWKDEQWAYLCDTLEEAVRNKNKRGKYPHTDERGFTTRTAIPAGNYVVAMNVQSPKYSDFDKYPFAKPYKGCIPRLVNIKKFDSVLVKPGMRATQLHGSIVVGINNGNDRMCDSVLIWNSLMQAYLQPAKLANEQITIEINEKS